VVSALGLGLDFLRVRLGTSIAVRDLGRRRVNRRVGELGRRGLDSGWRRGGWEAAQGLAAAQGWPARAGGCREPPAASRARIRCATRCHRRRRIRRTWGTLAAPARTSRSVSRARPTRRARAACACGIRPTQLEFGAIAPRRAPSGIRRLARRASRAWRNRATTFRCAFGPADPRSQC
jgi:hypothetical protein